MTCPVCGDRPIASGYRLLKAGRYVAACEECWTRHYETVVPKPEPEPRPRWNAEEFFGPSGRQDRK